MSLSAKLILAVCLFGIISNPAFARRYDTGLIAYERWLAEDYRYETGNMPSDYILDSEGMKDREIIRESKKAVDFSEGGKLDPIGAVFGVIDWIGDSLRLLLGGEIDDPYQANP